MFISTLVSTSGSSVMCESLSCITLCKTTAIISNVILSFFLMFFSPVDIDSLCLVFFEANDVLHILGEENICTFTG